MSLAAETTLAGWPVAAVLALLIAAERLRAGRRRTALNRALHELRRPLQLLALSPHGPGTGPAAPLRLAFAALARLDEEINGGCGRSPHLVSCRQLVSAAVGRWRSRAGLAGGSISLRWQGGDGALVAEPAAVAQALDNLIVNALEHGGPNLVVEGREAGGRLRIAVRDDGPPSGSSRPGSPIEVIERLTGRARHGHGLEIVRSFARQHQGRFALQRSDDGSVAILELPLAATEDSAAA